MRHALLLAIGFTASAGCQPPDAVTLGDTAVAQPEIRLLYPDANVPISLDPTDGNLRFMVVVDLVGIEFNDPGLATNVVDGEGHWHLSLNDAYVDAPDDLYYELDQEGWNSGEAVKLTVTLQDNEHADLDQYAGWQDILEFVIE